MTSSRTRLGTRSGLTLVEILIALTMTLVVLGAMMTAFQYASQQMQMGRGVMEMANRLRAAEELLRDDFSNLTVDPRPYTEATNPNGYFEITEGPQRDLIFPLTGIDTSTPPDGILDGIPDGDVDGTPDPADYDVTGGAGGVDLNLNGVDDRFDRNLAGFSYKGDYDDVWAGTIRSEDQPFRGRYIATNTTMTVDSIVYPTIDPTLGTTTSVIESPVAEVIWWTALQDDSDFMDEFDADSVGVYRRALLIRPGIALPTFLTMQNALNYLAATDLSIRVVGFTAGDGTPLFSVVANDIKELANRQNRYCHQAAPNAFGGPVPRRLLNRTALWNLRSSDYVGTINGTTHNIVTNGNDLILTDVTAFDLKVYSPNTNIRLTGGVTVEPHDVGFVTGGGAVAALGGYTDLGHGGTGWFSGYATGLSQLSYQYRWERFVNATPPPLFTPPPTFAGLMETVYDTWTPLYESDGLDQDFSGLADQGTNGVDDGGTAAPDDEAERETSPPYPFPVRGIKASIRLIEKNTKQVHQSSVIHSYVPE